MANQQAKSAANSTDRTNTTPINLTEALDQMRSFGLNIPALNIDSQQPVRCTTWNGSARRGWYHINSIPMESGGSVLVGAYGIWRGDLNDMRRVVIPARLLNGYAHGRAS